MTASELAHTLRARRHGGYFMACCPAHPDRTPSLSIRDGENGVRLHCFVGCENKAILAALGITFRDLGYTSEPEWKRRIRTAAVRPAGHRKPLGELQATYRYTNEWGELVAEKLRFEGKVFLWRRPQAGGGWIWKVDRDSLPLYRLHDVAQAETVCLVEGEKDADNLFRFVRPGTAVTTAPNGAKSWRQEFAHILEGKKIWIIPDSDAPGQAYAVCIAKSLCRTAKAVRLVTLPAPFKDVSDYLQQHTPADLSHLFSRAPLWTSQRRTA